MDSQLSDLGLMPSDEYPAWEPEPDAPKTVYAEVDHSEPDVDDCAECSDYLSERDLLAVQNAMNLAIQGVSYVNVAPAGTRLDEAGWKRLGYTDLSKMDVGFLSADKIQAGSICVGRMHVDPETGKWTEFTPEEYAAEDARLRELSHYKAYVRPTITDALIKGNK